MGGLQTMAAIAIVWRVFVPGPTRLCQPQQFQPGMWRPASVAPGFDARAEARQLDPSISGRLSRFVAPWPCNAPALEKGRALPPCHAECGAASKELGGLELLRKWLSEPEEKGSGIRSLRSPKPFHCKALRQPEQEDTECLRACLVLLRTLGRERRAA